VSDAEAADVSRRTRLAAERTWLAWWRSGIAATAASLAVGAFAPDLIEGARWPYVILGVGYATLAVSMFVVGEARKRAGGRARDEGGYAPLPGTWTVALSAAGGALAIVTLLVVLLT
jgi:uncharacterized membrane protein YidH (DUF202 family)